MKQLNLIECSKKVVMQFIALLALFFINTIETLHEWAFNGEAKLGDYITMSGVSVAMFLLIYVIL